MTSRRGRGAVDSIEQDEADDFLEEAIEGIGCNSTGTLELASDVIRLELDRRAWKPDLDRSCWGGLGHVPFPGCLKTCTPDNCTRKRAAVEAAGKAAP